MTNLAPIFVRPRFALPKRRTALGFTLVELLIVVAILAVCLSMMRPTVAGLVVGQQVTRAANELSMLIEYARTQATSRQTYTWVLFGSGKGFGGEDRLFAVVVASLDGTPNFSADNILEVSRKLSFENVVLADAHSLNSRTQAMLPEGARGVQVASSTPGVRHQLAGIVFSQGFAFTPRGEAMVNASVGETAGFDRMIDIGLRLTRGGRPPDLDADDAAVVLFGSSGRVLVVRL